MIFCFVCSIYFSFYYFIFLWLIQCVIWFCFWRKFLFFIKILQLLFWCLKIYFLNLNLDFEVARKDGIWKPARQSDVIAKIIEAFEWLFLIRFSHQLFLVVISVCLAGFHICIAIWIEEKKEKVVFCLQGYVKTCIVVYIKWLIMKIIEYLKASELKWINSDFI